MRYSKLISFLLLLTLLVSLCTFELSANQDEENPALQGITAQQYVLMDGTTGQILYEKNMNERIHPASTTKILTALMVINSGINLDTVVTVSEDAVSSLPAKATHIALVAGERLSLEDLLYGLLLASANDAANAIAEMYIDRQVADPSSLTFEQKIALFGQQMTEYAKSLGCNDSNFVNPHGLYEENHYSTPLDMAKILFEASQNINIKQILFTVKHTIPATNKQEARTWILTSNKLIRNEDYYYKYCTGGKTGYTELSGYGFIGTAEKGDQKLVCAVYNCSSENDGDDRFSDAKLLFEYGFNSFQKITIPSSELPRAVQHISDGSKIVATATVYSQSPLDLYILNNMTKDDVEIINNTPEIIDETNPTASYTIKINNTENLMYGDAGTYPLFIKIERLQTPIEIDVTENTEATEKPSETPTENSQPGNKNDTNMGVVVIIIVFCLLMIAILILVALYVVSNKKRQTKAKEKHYDEAMISKNISQPTEGRRAKQSNNVSSFDDDYPTGKRFKK